MNESDESLDYGHITAIYGSLIEIKGLEKSIRLNDMIEILKHNILGEIIQIYSDHVVAQCFENTNNLKLSDKVINLKESLSMELAPGLLTKIFDGTQRPLEEIFSKSKEKGLLEVGTKFNSLSRTKKWRFTPTKELNEIVGEGDIIGKVQETSLVEHMIMVPPGNFGVLSSIVEEDEYTIIDEIYRIRNKVEEKSFNMLQKWPIYKNRPYKKRYKPSEPLITGMRVIDLLFPLAKGGTVAVPGGFGTGKCVSAETPVLLSSGEISKIKEIYDFHKKNQNNIDMNEESLIEINDKLEVLSFNNVGFKIKNATHIYKGKTDRLVKIKTRTGRSLELTPIHKLHYFNGKDISEKAAQDLKEGDYIAVPRKINIDGKEIFFNIYDMDDSLRIADEVAIKEMKNLIKRLLMKYQLKEIAKQLDIPHYLLKNYWNGSNKPPLRFIIKLINLTKSPPIDIKTLKTERQSKPFKVPKKLTEEIAEWLGLFVADGQIKGEYGGVYLYNTSNQILNRFKELTNNAFSLNAQFGQDSAERTPFMYIRNTTFTKFLHFLGIPKKKKTYEIEIPKCILKSSENILIHFLNGYFAGDGWFSKYTIGFSTASKKLHIGLCYLISRLGILYRISKKGNSYYLELEGKRSEELAIIFKTTDIYIYDKLRPLFEYIEQNVNHFDSLDVVPIDIRILEALKQQGRDNQGHNIFRKNAGIKLDNYIKRKQIPTLSMLKKIYSTIEKYEPNVENELIIILKKLLKISKNIYFDRIEEIKNINKKTDVYDLTVEDYHNFIGGNQPVLLHNTVIQQSLAKWSDADVIIYCGVGERGNEIADVLHQFSKIIDPKSGRPLLERIVIIANTSNMPVSAREASIFSGVTIGEYYRDMGYNVAVLADSTSRWAEALREISGLLEEMPAEEGYPAYLPSKLSNFYERAGAVSLLGASLNPDDRKGSLTIIGSVSPPSGDFSEPVTSTTKRYVQAFWALDARLAYSKHYPAISWLNSYSNYPDYLSEWWKNKDIAWEEIPDLDWYQCRIQVNEILSKESELKNITQLIGEENLPEEQQLILFIAKLIKNSLLIQNAFDDIDCYTEIEKLLSQIKIILLLNKEAKDLLKLGYIMEDIIKLNVINDILRICRSIPNNEFLKIESIKKELLKEIESIKLMFGGNRERLYNNIEKIIGPLIFIKNHHDIQYGEIVKINSNDGQVRHGQVVKINQDFAVIEVFESTSGLSANNSKITFTGETFKIKISKDMFGKIFNSFGNSIDNNTRKVLDSGIITDAEREINGSPINPYARDYPSDVIQTGVSVIDGLFTLIRGQKLPIFSGQGMPHNKLAAQIVSQSKVMAETPFLIIFCGIGIIQDDFTYYLDRFEKSGNRENIISFINFADDNIMERLIIPRVALTTAEYFAFEKDMHVLVILTDMTNYAEALRELSSAKEEVPSRKGYPGYLYSDFASIFERTGKIKGKKGSITQIPILTMPNDDISHPIPDTAGYITEGQLVLDRGLFKKGVYPPLEVLASISRLMKDAIGKKTTRDDHADVSSQLLASYSNALEVRDLISIIGEDGLNFEQKALIKFGDLFESNFLNQGPFENRDFTKTLDLAWEILSVLPSNQFFRVHQKYINKYYEGGM